MLIINISSEEKKRDKAKKRRTNRKAITVSSKRGHNVATYYFLAGRHCFPLRQAERRDKTVIRFSKRRIARVASPGILWTKRKKRKWRGEGGRDRRGGGLDEILPVPRRRMCKLANQRRKILRWRYTTLFHPSFARSDTLAPPPLKLWIFSSLWNRFPFERSLRFSKRTPRTWKLDSWVLFRCETVCGVDRADKWRDISLFLSLSAFLSFLKEF